MRERLIESTLHCLQEHGYHGCSISIILNHAGVSRGAWSHHFRSKKELVAAAARYVLDQSVRLAGEQAASLKEKGDLLEVLDFIWLNFFTGRNRDAWLEFSVACRTDTELRDLLLADLADFQQTLDGLWSEHFAPADGHGDERMVMNMTLCMIRGMALQSITYDRPEFYLEMRREWARLLGKLVRLKADG